MITHLQLGAGAAAIATAALVACPGVGVAHARDVPPAEASVRLDPRHESGGAVAPRFVGLSIEWSLVQRYMGANARPGFVNLLRNLRGGVLRMGGSSQDLMPFDAESASNRAITAEDLGLIRATVDATGSWRAVLGTAMAPPGPTRPFVSPDHAHAFVTQGVAPAFTGAEGDVAGIELGNEPDLSYGTSRLDDYFADLARYSDPAVTGPFPFVAPNTSEDILPWETIAAGPTRYFWEWPRILDLAAPEMRARGGFASDHFYPLARTCVNRPYRCPSIPALLSAEHMSSLDYQVYRHAREAAAHEVGYRLEETNTASGRGADGVSNVAASATYTLSMMFHAACPQPPDDPGGNAECEVGATGINLHNAEVRAFFFPEEGNAYYNAIDYDPSPAMGSPKAAPEYYALLLFSRFAQGASGLRPVAVGGQGAPQVEAWRVQGDASERRLFLINKGDAPITLEVAAPGSSYELDRMTPYDPDGAGRTLDAPAVRIDGREVASDGTWPGFDPVVGGIDGERFQVTVAAGEAAVVALHGHDD